MSPQRNQKIIDRAIAYMELEEFQDRFIDELSGGQRQRALIAMVIAQDTEYVLLDEPHQQSGYLPCHQYDENRPPPLRRAGEDGDFSAA